jgi:hypothetical protein
MRSPTLTRWLERLPFYSGQIQQSKSAIGIFWLDELTFIFCENFARPIASARLSPWSWWDV